MKAYKNFDEIDKELKLIQLRADVAKQKAKIDLQMLQQELSFTNLAAEAGAYFSKGYLYKYIMKLIWKKLKNS